MPADPSSRPGPAAISWSTASAKPIRRSRKVAERTQFHGTFKTFGGRGLDQKNRPSSPRKQTQFSTDVSRSRLSRCDRDEASAGEAWGTSKLRAVFLF